MVNAISSQPYTLPLQSVAPKAYHAYHAYHANVQNEENTGNGIFGGFSTDFTSISSMASHAAGGGVAAYKFGLQMNDNMRSVFGNGFKGALGGIKNTALTGLKGAGLSALVSVGVSAVANGIGVATGKVERADVAHHVINDGIGGAVGGLVGVTAAGLASFIPVKGVMGTVLTVGAGAVGSVLGSQMVGEFNWYRG